jgi:hypothetical protein
VRSRCSVPNDVSVSVRLRVAAFVIGDFRSESDPSTEVSEEARGHAFENELSWYQAILFSVYATSDSSQIVA